MARNLDELKDELYQTFNDARDKARDTLSISAYSYPEIAKASVMALQAASDAARAIVQVEHEIAEREEKKNGMKLPGKN